MFGKNAIRKQELLSTGTLYVKEIFSTIQGEGPFAGWPAIFVRLVGCNLACWFCDTDFEGEGIPYTPEQLVAAVDEVAIADGANVGLVVITGGEPFRQNLVPAINLLVAGDWVVQIETAGTLGLPDFPWEHSHVNVVVSPKTGKLHPSMAQAHAWKYIISAGEVNLLTGLPTASTQQQGKQLPVAAPLNGSPVYVQPMDVQDPEGNRRNMAATVEVAKQHGYFVSLQTHKILGVP